MFFECIFRLKFECLSIAGVRQSLVINNACPICEIWIEYLGSIDLKADDNFANDSLVRSSEKARLPSSAWVSFLMCEIYF